MSVAPGQGGRAVGRVLGGRAPDCEWFRPPRRRRTSAPRGTRGSSSPPPPRRLCVWSQTSFSARVGVRWRRRVLCDPGGAGARGETGGDARRGAGCRPKEARRRRRRGAGRGTVGFGRSKAARGGPARSRCTAAHRGPVSLACLTR